LIAYRNCILFLFLREIAWNKPMCYSLIIINDWDLYIFIVYWFNFISFTSFYFHPKLLFFTYVFVISSLNFVLVCFICLNDCFFFDYFFWFFKAFFSSTSLFISMCHQFVLWFPFFPLVFFVIANIVTFNGSHFFFIVQFLLSLSLFVSFWDFPCFLHF